MASNSDLSALRQQFAELERPLAKCSPPSAEELCQDRAAEAFRAGLAADGESQRAYARRVRRDERLVRDWADGSRSVPLWVFFRLRRAGQIAAFKLLIAAVPEHDELDEESARRVA